MSEISILLDLLFLFMVNQECLPIPGVLQNQSIFVSSLPSGSMSSTTTGSVPVSVSRKLVRMHGNQMSTVLYFTAW